MIDLHCHLLPGVDDGARSVDQAVRVLEAMQEAGVTAVCLTPHFSMGRVSGGLPEAHEIAFDELTLRAPQAVALFRGVELMLDRPVTGDLLDCPGLTLAGGKHLLVEFTRMVAVPAVTNALYQLVQLGLVPVLAHPERYQACEPATVAQWRSIGGIMQVDATTLLTARGRGRRARELLAHGLADIIAADNHGDDRMLGTAYRYLCEQGAEHQADLLARKNPGAILEGGELAPVPPFTIKTAFLDRLKQLMGDDE